MSSEAHRQGQLLRQALRIRAFEERLLRLFSEGKLNGTVHTCIGEEWSGVAVVQALRPQDTICTNHRGHGHYIARTDDVRGLVAEIMGRSSGACGGVGGSQHLHAPGFYSNGVQGGMVPVAVGLGLASAASGREAVSVVFIGDGTLGEGLLYESLNLASCWDVPLLVVVENNGYAQSTPTRLTTAGSVEGRASAFGVQYRKGDTWNWEALLGVAAEAVSYVRRHGRPLVLEIETYRLKAHSKGDDTRPAREIAAYLERDPLHRFVAAQPEVHRVMRDAIEAELDAAVAAAEAAPAARFEPRDYLADAAVTWRRTGAAPRSGRRPGRYADLLHDALASVLEHHPEAILLGEDVEGPYGGAFKISRDLSARFPGRVRNTPISEAAIVGVGTGLALAGHLPIVEIMFGDFLTLTLDQLLQHATKFSEMYDRRVQVPLVVRTPMGGKRGYGPTHSQSLEKFFLGVPELDIVALNQRLAPADVYGALAATIRRPTLVVENKILYTRPFCEDPIAGYEVTASDERFPTIRIAPGSGEPDVTVVCYGGALADVEAAVGAAVDEDDVVCEVVCPAQLQPLNVRPILESARRARSLVTVEEGTRIGGFGSEVVARLSEVGCRPERVVRVGYDSVIPSALSAETALLPDAEAIRRAIRKAAHG